MTDRAIKIAFPKVRGRRWSRWRRLRQAVQILALLLFLYLLVASWSAGEALSITDLIFRLNPLTALTAMVAGRTWIPTMALALITGSVPGWAVQTAQTWRFGLAWVLSTTAQLQNIFDLVSSSAWTSRPITDSYPVIWLFSLWI